MRRIRIIAALALTTFALGWASAAQAVSTPRADVAAEQLTSKNSIVYQLFTESRLDFDGVGCGSTATFTKTLPPGSTGITVKTPSIGDRDLSPDAATRITAISVVGRTITVTTTADGPAICDPELTGFPPGEPVTWSAEYPGFRAEYSRRIQTTLRIFYESYTFGAKWKIRPKVISDSRAGTPRRNRARVIGIRWQRFGGKKAVGYGRNQLDYCRKGERCPDNGKRARLVATRPGFCLATGQFEYLKLNVYVGSRLDRGAKLTCE